MGRPCRRGLADGALPTGPCRRGLADGALPDGFAVGQGPSGMELTWSPTGDNDRLIRMGGSRPEFRMPNGKVFGYPREMQGKLVLTMSSQQQDLMAANGQDLQVWVSRRRQGGTAAATTARPAAGAAAAAADSMTTPTVPVDPAARGAASIQRLSYTLPGLDVGEFPFPLEVVGEVTQPRQLTAGVKYPLVLFLHGRHATCYQGGPKGFDSGDWPCGDGFRPIPSYQGYRYVADILAS
jgi:hypothetical protein